MSKSKKIVEVNGDWNSVGNFVSSSFFYAMENDTLSIDDNFVYAETSKEIYKININILVMALLKPSKQIYSRLEEECLVNKIGVHVVDSLFQWTNPVFEKLDIEPMIQFINKFRTRMKTDEKYYKNVRDISFSVISKLIPEERKKYINRFLWLGIFDEKDKIELRYFEDEPISKIKLFLEENKDLSHDDIVNLVAQVYSYEKFSDEIKGKKKYNSRIVNIMNLLSAYSILDIYLSGGISDEEFIRTKVKKEDILSQPYNLLLDYLEKANNKMPNNLKISSKDLVNEYGKNLSGNVIYRFLLGGYINLEDFIDIYEINKALKMVDYDQKDMFEDEEIRAVYSPEILIKMQRDGCISPEFIQKYLEMQDFENNQEMFRSKSIMLKEEIIKSENPQELALYFFNIGFCDLETVKEVVDSKYFENKFENDEMSREEIFDYYRKGIIDDEVISKFYIDEEILEMYDNGEISGECLKIISDTDVLVQEFCEGRIGIQDFLGLYLNSDKLSINDLNDALELSEIECDISAFIDESTPFEKIKELFSHFLIDYASILVLKSQGVINEEQFAEIKKTLDTREFFEEIEAGKKFKVLTSREGKSNKRERKPESEKKSQGSFLYEERGAFSSEMDLISIILGKDAEKSGFSLIESNNEKGRPTTLNDYRIFGNEKLDGIVILQKDQKGNAVYVMNVLQLMYFLRGKENENGEFEVQDRMKDKAYLKRIEGVEVVEHSKYFGRNLIEAASRVSKAVAERMKKDDKKYVTDVQIMIDYMIEEYMENKVKSIND